MRVLREDRLRTQPSASFFSKIALHGGAGIKSLLLSLQSSWNEHIQSKDPHLFSPAASN
jgi:hypothetical protein